MLISQRWSWLLLRIRTQSQLASPSLLLMCWLHNSSCLLTATGTPSAARSRTSGYLILGASLERRTPPRGAGSRSPAPASDSVASTRGAPPTPTTSGPAGPRHRCSPWANQRCRHDSEIPKSFAIWRSELSPLRATATTSRRNSEGNALGMVTSFPARTNPHTTEVNRTRGRPRSLLSVQGALRTR